jgi:dTMP kinase
VLATLENWVQGVPAVAPQLRQPQLTVWFDLAPEIAAQRLAGARVPDKFESQPQAFFARVAAGYAARLQADPKRFLRVNADQPKDAVWAEVQAGLSQRGLL